MRTKYGNNSDNPGLKQDIFHIRSPRTKKTRDFLLEIYYFYFQLNAVTGNLITQKLESFMLIGKKNQVKCFLDTKIFLDAKVLQGLIQDFDIVGAEC